MSQLQGESAPTQLLVTGAVVHLALWSPLLNQTRCGVSFDPNRVLDGAACADEPISCMTCLVRADVFEIPLQDDEPTTNHFNERVWLKQVFGPPYNHVTECCHGECPCDWHKPKQS